MMKYFRILRARLMAGVPKLKQLPRTLMEALPVIAKEGVTSPVRVKARREDRKRM